MYKIQPTKEQKKQIKKALWGNSDKVIFNEIDQGVSHVFLTKNKNMLVVGRFESREFVVVAAVGSDLFNNRQNIIEYARANGARTIRFHTINPGHLKKGLAGLQVILSAVRARKFGNDELIYKLSI